MKFATTKHGKRLLRKIKSHGFHVKVIGGLIIVDESPKDNYGFRLVYNNPVHLLKTLRQHWPI